MLVPKWVTEAATNAGDTVLLPLFRRHTLTLCQTWVWRMWKFSKILLSQFFLGPPDVFLALEPGRWPQDSPLLYPQQGPC